MRDDKSRFGAIRAPSQSKPKSGKSGFEYEQFLSQLETVANQVSQQKLENMKAALHRVYTRRFKARRRTPKYGTINKGFTELELRQFLMAVKHEKFRLLFKYQAYMGLRIGEACSLHISNIGFDKRELTFRTEKAGKMDTLRIPEELFKETVEYIARNEAEIEASNGYVFFKNHDNNDNKLQHVEVNYVRKVFRESTKVAGLNQIYGTSDETYAGHKERQLFRLTTHSLRHYAITRFAKSTNGNIVLTSRFARHSRPDITMTYVGKDQEELFGNIDFAFSANRLRSLQEKFPHLS